MRMIQYTSLPVAPSITFGHGEEHQNHGSVERLRCGASTHFLAHNLNVSRVIKLMLTGIAWIQYICI